MLRSEGKVKAKRDGISPVIAFDRYSDAKNGAGLVGTGRVAAMLGTMRRGTLHKGRV